jgi:phosphomannomutase / phosphoglucomutase
MTISKYIFKDYDIRGAYPDELNEETAEVIGKALGTIFAEQGIRRIVVGRDNRESSPGISDAVIKALLSTCCNVTNIGITLTPVIYFLTCILDFEAGVNITASHNPKKFNGIKINYKNARQFYGKDIQKVLEYVNNSKFVEGKGSYKEESLTEKYKDFIKKAFSYTKKYKVVFNCGNGATSEIVPEVLSSFGIDLQPINCKFDSSFPHEVPNPESPAFMDELKDEVLKNNADIGFGLDTDGDRFGVVDEKGNAYTADRILLLLAKDALKTKPGSTFLFDVKSSQVVGETIKELGGIPKMMRTGRSYFIEEVTTGKALMGAEFSGHIYIGDGYYGYDDGLYVACRILKIMEKEGRSLFELMSEFPQRVGTPEIKISCPDDKKFEVVENIIKNVGLSGKYKDVSYIDGVRAKVSDTGWFLIRASNTSPYLSARVEGVDETEVEEIKKEVDKLVSEVI